MVENPGIILTIIAFLLVLGPLVFIHELGHYLVGRWCGVKADVFSIGFGKEIFGWTDKRQTRWKVAMLPLGGYVQFKGDMDPSSRGDSKWLEMPSSEREQCFQAKPLWKRAAIVFAGPAINFLFAILILAGFAYAWGVSETPPVVGQVMENSAAERAGLQAGDRIVRVDREEISTFNELRRRISHRPGEKIELSVEREQRQMMLPLVIGTELLTDRFGNEYRYGQLGVINSEPVMREISLLEAPVIGAQKAADIVHFMVETLGQIITGKRSARELGGPLKIAQVSGEQLNAGPEAFIFFIALISINLGFINLLPIPMLDGGHLLFYGIEAIKGEPASPNVMEWAFRGGLAMVMALMLFVTFNDLVSFGLFR